MCGIAGVMSRFISMSEQSVFEDIFTMATMRGRRGAGVILVQADTGKTNFFRTTDNAVSLMELQRYDELQKPRMAVMIGHARAPTKGGDVINAVHPHRADHILGVHNGTLFKVNGKPVGDESDSKLLFQDIAARGIDEAIKNVSGAYALVWVDSKQKTVNFLRNDDRTLYFGHTDQTGEPFTLYWGSEYNMVGLAMLRQNIYKPKIYPLTPDTLLSYPLTPKAALSPEKREVKQEKTFFQGYNHHTGGGHGTMGRRTWGWVNGVWQVKYDETGSALPSSLIKQDGTRLPALPPPRQVTVPAVNLPPLGEPVLDASPEYMKQFMNNKKGKKLTRRQEKKLKAKAKKERKGHNIGHTNYLETLRHHFLRPSDVQSILEKKGCAFCGTKEDIDAYDRKNVRWIDRDEFLCEECGESPLVRDQLLDVYPKGWPEFEGAEDEPKAVDEQMSSSLSADERLVEKMHEAHKYH